MKNKENAGQNHQRFLFILLTLIIVASLAVSQAEGTLFSLLDTPAPAATPAPAVTQRPAMNTSDLFALLDTAEVAPASTDTPVAAPQETALFFGFGYADMTGRAADRQVENTAEGTLEFIYEQVTEDDFHSYGVFLRNQGCGAEKTSTSTKAASSYVVYHEEKQVAFLVIFESALQRLTLVYAPDEAADAEEPGAQQGPSNESASLTREPANVTVAQHQATVCPYCNRGLCSECHGAGYFRCSDCRGSGSCPTCRGRRQSYSAGYGGVGTGVYTPCYACGGNGRCDSCNGSGREDCAACDHGVCRFCLGHYVIAP